MAKSKDELKDVKDELTEYMKERIDIEVEKKVNNATKKLIKHKNIVIIKRDIIILVLLLAYVFLCYNLYNTNYFDKFFKKYNTNEVVQIESNTESKASEDEPNLKDEYSYLLDYFIINENSEYIKDYCSGKLSDELRLYLSINVLRTSSSGDSIEYLDESDLEEAYEEIFKGDITNKSFKYNDCKFKYIDKKDLYILDGEIIKKTNIEKSILNVYEKNNRIIIETTEGLIKDSKLYNIISKKEIKNYNGDNISEYKKDLTNLRYTFDKDDLKILSIEVVK